MALEPSQSVVARLKQHVELLDRIGDDDELNLDHLGAQVLADDIAEAVKQLQRMEREIRRLRDA